MVRYLIILAVAGLSVALFWPYLRKLDPARKTGGGAPAPTRAGDSVAPGAGSGVRAVLKEYVQLEEQQVAVLEVVLRDAAIAPEPRP